MELGINEGPNCIRKCKKGGQSCGRSLPHLSMGLPPRPPSIYKILIGVYSSLRYFIYELEFLITLKSIFSDFTLQSLLLCHPLHNDSRLFILLFSIKYTHSDFTLMEFHILLQNVIFMLL